MKELQTEEIFKRIVEIIQPKVHSIRTINLTQRRDLIYGMQGWDLTVFYKKNKNSKYDNHSWFVFANEHNRIRTLEQLCEKLEKGINEI